MGRHRADRRDHQGLAERMSSATDAADPERRELVEPDREGQQGMSSGEQDARSRVYSDRDPVDDIHLAAADPREVEGGH